MPRATLTPTRTVSEARDYIPQTTPAITLHRGPKRQRGERLTLQTLLTIAMRMTRQHRRGMRRPVSLKFRVSFNQITRPADYEFSKF